MIKIDKKYQGIVLLIIVALSLSIIKYRFGYKSDSSNKIQKVATPTSIVLIPTSNEASDAANKFQSVSYPLWNKLPYQGKGFTIDKYSSPMTLEIKLTKSTKEYATKEVNVWLKSFGDLGKGHKIEFAEQN